MNNNRFLKFVFLLSILVNCSNDRNINPSLIDIVKIRQHPFLKDHCKKIIINKIGVNEEIEIYCDAGNGCDTYLFDSDTAFILIDCNGQWYNVNKSSGDITDVGWRWEESLPEQYLGTYKSIEGNNKYKLEKETKVNLSEVYKYKDPN